MSSPTPYHQQVDANKSLSTNEVPIATDAPLLLIRQLKGKTFYIDSYQRGYRWGPREIHSLLNDINTFNKEENPESYYCLQPLVIKEKSAGHYELIDGQQRCTTIYFILKCLLDEDFYQIKYETRGDNEGINPFLSSIDKLDLPNLSTILDDHLDHEIWRLWKENLKKPQQIANTVDNFFFFRAWCIINRWIGNNQARKDSFESNLLDKTKIIWYLDEAGANETANTFINFNNGKISLDEAELIKGLYVLNFAKDGDQTHRLYEENQFADDWNNIEHRLKAPSFWNFIHHERDNRLLANKITLLLQIEKGKAKKAEDQFFTYRAYEKAFESDEKPQWRTLAALYNQLEEWYNDRTTYHLMGAVVHLTQSSILNIVDDYKKKSKKDELHDYLRGKLRRIFIEADGNFKDRYDPDKLKYSEQGVFPILLLYNIAVAHLTDTQYRFRSIFLKTFPRGILNISMPKNQMVLPTKPI